MSDNFTSKNEASYLQEQYLVFYIIILLFFFGITFACMKAVRENGTLMDYMKDARADFFNDNENPCFLWFCVGLPIFIFFLGIFYGPFLFVFNLAFKENFKKGCKTLFFAHIYTNILFPLIFCLFMGVDDYFMKRKYFNERKNKIISKSNFTIEIFTFILILFGVLSGFSFYFSRNFEDTCKEDNSEITFFAITFLISYFVSNLMLIIKSEILFLSFYLVLVSFTAIILLHLTLQEYISREIFYSILMFSNFYFFIFITIGQYFYDFYDYDKDEHFRKTIGKSKKFVWRYGYECQNEEPLLLLTVTDYYLQLKEKASKDKLKWKIKEKNFKLKQKQEEIFE